MAGLNIGITFRDDLSSQNMWWGSGIAQHIKFYYDLFESMGHSVTMLTAKDDVTLSHNGKAYQCVSMTQAVNSGQQLDIVLEAGLTISLEDKLLIREATGAKIVGLRCGNQFFFATEGLFVQKELPENLYIGGQDRMWILPHHGNQKSFLATLHSCDVDIAPYMWMPDFVEHTLIDKPLGNSPDIFVMEPNISVLKNAMLPMTILEHLYQAHPDSFNQAYILNSEGFAQEDRFLHNFVSNLSVLQSDNDRVFFCPRHTINDVFTDRGILLGFQYDNGLNNLYMEALHMGIPLVHNSPFFSRVGFYYPELEVHKGVEQILKAVECGDAPEQQQKNNEFLFDFNINNPHVVREHDQLLAMVLDPPRFVDETRAKIAQPDAYRVSEGGSADYYLAPGYRSRTDISHWDDTGSTDEYQNDVYKFALRTAIERGYSKIVDFGCGSGFKLMKYFRDFDTTGYELDPALSFLKQNYPERMWREGGFEAHYFDDVDMVICSDVIEHLPQPDILLKALRDSSAKSVILSTPSLEILADWGGTASTRYGPPAIPMHFREWTTFEFGKFVSEYLPVTEHHVLDVYQSTQLLYSNRENIVAAMADDVARRPENESNSLQSAIVATTMSTST